MAHLLQSVNQYWCIIITQTPCFTLGLTFGIVYSMGFDICIMTFSPYCIAQGSFTALKILYALPYPWLLATTDPFSVSIDLFSPVYHIVGIIEYTRFSNWLHKKSNKTEVTEHARTKEYLGYFQVLAVVNKAAINIHVKGFVWTKKVYLVKYQRVQFLNCEAIVRLVLK